ncbi:MAG: hypothetical protein ACI4ET_14335 [Bilifractor sp.]
MDSFYLTHYFDFKNAGSFFLVSFLCLAAVMAVILAVAHAQTGYHGKKDEARMDTRTLRAVRRTHFSWIESFYEMVFSSTSVLLFLSVYYQLDAYWSPLSQYWQKYRDILLLVFILLSVLLTSWFDVALVKLTHIRSEQKACIRLLSSFYIILILLYIKFIYQDDNYDTLIQYFLLLAAGRFLYFDFTMDWFKETLAGLWRNLPMLGLMAVYSAIVCWYGFKVGFLLKSNGVIVSTLIAHLFMDLCIFVMHKTKLLRYFIPDATGQSPETDRAAAGSRQDRQGTSRAYADSDRRGGWQSASRGYMDPDRRDGRQRVSYGHRDSEGQSRRQWSSRDNMSPADRQGWKQSSQDDYPQNLNYAQRMRMESGQYGTDTLLASLERHERQERRWNQPDYSRSDAGRDWSQDDPDARFSDEALSRESSGLQSADTGVGEKTHVIRKTEELYQEDLHQADEIHVPEYKLDDTEMHALSHGTERWTAGHLNYYQRKKQEENNSR